MAFPMSEVLRIGFAVEGTTDLAMLHAAVSAQFPGAEIEGVYLQPEVSESFVAIAGTTGVGWPGVYRWCREVSARGGGSVSGGVILDNYDAVILQIDADVATATYADGHIVDDTGDLPCDRPCPLATDTTDRLKDVLLRWLGETTIPDKLIFCIPSKALEAWILVALYPNDSTVRSGGIECCPNPTARLGSKPLNGRLVSGGRKNVEMYESRCVEFGNAWHRVVERCTLAKEFSAALQSTLV